MGVVAREERGVGVWFQMGGGMVWYMLNENDPVEKKN